MLSSGIAVAVYINLSEIERHADRKVGEQALTVKLHDKREREVFHGRKERIYFCPAISSQSISRYVQIITSDLFACYLADSQCDIYVTAVWAFSRHSVGITMTQRGRCLFLSLFADFRNWHGRKVHGLGCKTAKLAEMDVRGWENFQFPTVPSPSSMKHWLNVIIPRSKNVQNTLYSDILQRSRYLKYIPIMYFGHFYYSDRKVCTIVLFLL